MNETENSGSSELTGQSDATYPGLATAAEAGWKASTLASSEPNHGLIEKEAVSTSKVYARLKGTTALAGSMLLAGTLLLSACGDDNNDCIPTSAPAGSATYVLPTPGPGQLPNPPASNQFTTGQATNPTQTYCRSRRTGGYYWYTGVSSSSSS